MDLGKINGFENVGILKKDFGYSIWYLTIKNGITYIEIPGVIIGAFSFLDNEEEMKSKYFFYETEAECLEVVKKRTLENLLKDFDENQIKNSKILLAVKNK